MSTLPATQCAIQITENGPSSVLVPRTLPVPQSLGPDQILVKNEFIGVNFIDTYHRTGLYSVKLPFIPGREAAGTIAALGDKIAAAGTFHVGDRVAYVSPGTYAAYTVCGNNAHIVRVPDGLTSDVAAACLLQGLTAYAFITRAYNVQKGDWVLVYAASGGVGQWLVQLLNNIGANVIAAVSSEDKAKLVREMGLERVIVTGRKQDTEVHQDVLQAVMGYTGGAGVKAVYDGIGRTTFNTTLACCDYDATVVSFGNASGKVEPFDIGRLSGKNLRLVRPTVMNYLRQPSEFSDMGNQLLRLVSEGKVKVHIHGVWPLEDAKGAHDALESGHTVGKLVLKP